MRGKREHLVGHVEPVGDARLADAPRGQDHVDAATRTEIEHGLALVQIGDRDRIATTKRRKHSAIRKLASLRGVVVLGAVTPFIADVLAALALPAVAGGAT